jgi:DNA modification methylase
MREEVIGDARLILGDCKEVMAGFAANSVDMIWTDPPYGHNNHVGDFNARLNEHRGLNDTPIANDSPDLMREVVDGMLVEAARILKHDCCCCCCCGGGGGPRPTFAWLAERMDRTGLSFFHSVIWDKLNPGIGWRYRRRHEMVMVAHRTGGTVLWADDQIATPNIVRVFPPRERTHPNEKPVELPIHFIAHHAPPGALILDPFMGSGTTGVAAIRLGRKFIGIEIEQRWFDVACRRIDAEARQGRLFDESADAVGSYNDAVTAIGKRVKAGEPLPDFFQPRQA